MGLWMGHRFAATSVYQEARQQAWNDLEGGASELLSRLKASPGGSPNLPGTTFGFAQGSSGAALPRGTCLLVVDPEWRLVNDSRSGLPARDPALPAGYRVSWASAEKQSSHQDYLTQSVRGTVDLPDGSYLAVAHDLPTHPGQVLFCLAESLIQGRASALLAGLPALNLVTLLWTVTLLAITVYVILAPLFDRFGREAAAASEQSLHKAQQLACTRDAVIFGLAKLADSRDPDTGDHLERIAAYSTTLAAELQRSPRYRDKVTSAFVKLIGISSALHDIGKVGIEDSILLKPGPLTSAERIRMQRHSVIGGHCLRDIEQRLGSSNFLQMAREIALGHHERWDGMGYPCGLSGRKIPLSARIVAIADVYDALATKRCYKDPLPHEECAAIIRDNAGAHFDPDLVEVWLSIESNFRDIARRHPSAAQPEVSRAEPMAQPTTGPKEDHLVAASAGASAPS